MAKFKAVRSSMSKLAAKQMRAKGVAAMTKPRASFTFDTSDAKPVTAKPAAKPKAKPRTVVVAKSEQLPPAPPPSRPTQPNVPVITSKPDELTEAELEKLTAPDKV